jgi:hypothetical protein
MRTLPLPLFLAIVLGGACTCDVTPTTPVLPGPPDALPPGDDDDPPDAGHDPDVPDRLVACVRVDAGDDVQDALVAEFTRLLSLVEPLAEDDCALVITLGDVEGSLVTDNMRAQLGPEGYAIARATDSRGAVTISVDGLPATWTGLDSVARSPGGAAFGAFALLEDLGFAFLHPLAPHVPQALDVDAVVARASSPRWPVRNVHLHTSHPIELSELLNGFGPGFTSDDDAAFDTERARWRSFLVWLIASGGNEAQWLLLESESWSDFALSTRRQARLRALVDDCRAFGVSCGITVPIVQHQQHSFRLITEIGDPVAEEAELRARLAWVTAAGFDYLVTSTGTTEFTHPTATQMLGWMDLLTRVAADEHGVETRMNIHVSHGQVAEPFVDPVTGEPLNFNFLPSIADARLAVLPHTVQMYGLDDPAPTYGNESFGFMRDFLQREVGRRRVMFHPETAYWVSVDVDVPLFLPLYAERRIADLQLLADDEDLGLMGRGEHAGGRMQGQDVFTSGWEWGYWLNDLVATRANWDPHRDSTTPEGALTAMLAPLARALGPHGDDVVTEIVELARDQRDTLIYGRTTPGGAPPETLDRLNGFAYLAGSEPFDDLATIADRIGVDGPKTQPFRLGLVEMRPAFHAPPRYTGEVDPLLEAMEQRFAARASTVRALLNGQDGPYARELDDAFAITALRAAQVHALYDSVDERANAIGATRLADARARLDEALVIAARRAEAYRMPADEIAGWRANPTAYRFTYLWTARTLWYWWRDELLAAEAPASPCVMNIIDPADVALGEGAVQTGTELLALLTAGGALEQGTACAAAPQAEPLPPPR